MDLGTLDGGLGCFPFDNGAYPSLSHCRGWANSIRSLFGYGTGEGPDPFSALPLFANNTTLYLNTFRGEPAISRFDWNFSAIHSSSPGVAAPVCSALHYLLQ